MRSRSVVTTLLTFTAGVAASVVARRLAGRRRPQVSVARAAAPAAVAPVSVDAAIADHDALVLPFTRPAPAAPAKPATPARCGENGGITKAGSPCAARATSGGRCHHHRVAA